MKLLLNTLSVLLLLSLFLSILLNHLTPSAPTSIPSTLSNAPTRIPNIIHQSWKAKRIHARSFVSDLTAGIFQVYPYALWIQSWTSRNPHWRYKFWDDQQNRDLFLQNTVLNPFLQTYDLLPSGVARSDMARYAYLYLYGGVYADIDFECLLSLDALATNYDLFLSPEPLAQTQGLYGKDMILCNAIMGSRPQHPFWMHLMENISRRLPYCGGTAVNCTGPIALQTAYEDYISKENDCPDKSVTVLPSQLFYPEVASYNLETIQQNCHQNQCNQEPQVHYPVFAKHHWACDHCRSHWTVWWVDIEDLIPSENWVSNLDQLV